jgi:hypothetical protein
MAIKSAGSSPYVRGKQFSLYLKNKSYLTIYKVDINRGLSLNIYINHSYSGNTDWAGEVRDTAAGNQEKEAEKKIKK